MDKKEFQARAKNFANIAKSEQAQQRASESIEQRRAIHVEEIKKFDPAAAEVERKYFDADNALAAAEMELAKYYAGKIEQ